MKECPACRRCFPDHVNHCPNDGDATTPSIAGEPILDGRYQLEKRLGHGGMGVVFKARHIFLKTAHAIKVILPDLVGNDPMLVTRFRQEALAAAAIRHQNIIAVTDFGVARGTMPFLVMEFVQGKSLHDILAAEGALPPTRALEMMNAIGSGIAAAHRQNIVHRDLKPLNIMLQDGLPVAEAVKILDFGLAKIKSGELLGSFVQAKTSGLMGSPFYMAPEQWSDEEPDVRADIYSLGVILYQMLGGDVPFKGTGIPSIMKKHLTAAPAPLASLGVSVPPSIEAVVRHALEKDADNRPQTVDAFISELRDAVAQTSASLNRTQMAGPGYQSETIITPSPPPPSVSMRPQPTTTTMRIRTTPPRARVSINSIEVGMSDGNGQMVITDIQPGKHLVRVRQDGYADWEGQIECSGGTCDVSAQLQSLMATSLPQMSNDQYAGTISAANMDSSQQQSYAAMEAQRLRAQAAQLEEQARREEAERRERERREQEERDRIAREEVQREEEARLRAQAEARERAEAEARQKAEEERKRAELEAQRRAEEQAAREKAEEAARLKAEEAEAARKQAEAEAVARKKAEEEAARLRAEQEEARRLAEQEAARRAEDERQRAEAEARRRAEEEESRRLAEQERLRAEAEARAKAEAEATRRAEEERARQQREQREREERERALQAERERIERERRELEEQRARLAATTVSPPVDLSQTQPQRQGITTGPVDPNAGAQSHPNIGYQSQPPFQASSPGFAASEPKKSGLPMGLIAAVIGVVLLVGGGGGIYMLTRSKPAETPQTPSNPNQKPGENNKPESNAPIKPDLVSLPGGSFQMGRSDGAEQEGPVHSVTVGAFSIDRTEVTNAEYAQFVAETGHTAPSHFRGGKPAGGQEQWPVTNVSLEDAKAFAAWRSKRDGVTYRLPTEEEWEYAAREGGQGNLFPWGDSWVEGKANVNAASLQPVGASADDKTRSGIVDMIGNAYEWTTSKASYYPGSRGQVRPDNKDWIIVRGGAYITDMSKRKISAAFRDWIPATTQNSGLGFRLVRAQ
ncbi:MAG TPA: SUMF1/EgtB/PvdO family nonheme iron enzyme [Pyrinomonadaceae bacterium]|jgi:serine/threonine protein kinase/formylglycine-generating enzyme required for sulfatase activity